MLCFPKFDKAPPFIIKFFVLVMTIKAFNYFYLNY